MKHLFITIIFAFSSIYNGLAITPKQVIIPMYGSNKMLFNKDSYNDYYIDGFAVDSLERFFFCGGDATRYISCFQDGKLLFIEKIGSYITGPMLLKSNYLYIYTGYVSNDILKSYRLTSTSACLDKNTNIISKEKINNVFFTDSNLVVETLETYIGDDGTDLKNRYELFDLSGQYKQEATNLYNLSPTVFKNEELGTYQYIGMYKQNYVFYSICNHDTCELSLRNIKGDIIMSQKIPMKLLGTMLTSSYGGNPEEHKKIKNDKLYILGTKEGKLYISIFPLQELFESI